MLAADEDIANKIVEIAKRRGSTVYGTLNEILQQALRADEMGLNLSYVIENRQKMEKAAPFLKPPFLYGIIGVVGLAGGGVVFYLRRRE